MIDTQYVGPILMGIAAVVGAVGLYLTRKTASTVTYADGWQGYAKKLESRIAQLEENEKILRESTLVTIKEKDLRIDALEARIDELEKELAKAGELGAKVDFAKENIHNTVENQLDEIKKQ